MLCNPFGIVLQARPSVTTTKNLDAVVKHPHRNGLRSYRRSHTAMQKLERTKEKGLKKLKQKSWKEAISEFTHVIDALPQPQADAEAVLKCECLIGRSTCKLAQGNKEDSLKDADAVIELYKQLRPEDKMKDATPEQLAADPLTTILARAYVRRGKVSEEAREFLNAFHEYAVGLVFDQKGEAQTATRDLLHKLSIPDLGQSDKDLQPFSVLLLAFCNEAELIVHLTSLLEYLQKTELSEELVKKFDSLQCQDLLYGLMQLYIENEFIVVATLAGIRMMGEKGVAHIFNGILVTRVAMITWSKSEKVMGEAIKLLRMSPPELYNVMGKADFIPLIVDALKLSLAEDEVESAFYIMFHVASHPSLLVQAAAEGVIDIILEKKTVGALMLLSKICMIPDIMKRIEEDGGIDWAVSMLKENPTKLEVGHATTIILARSLLNPADPENKEKLKERGRVVFDIVTPFLLKNNKDDAVVADAFSAIALSTEHAPEKVKELKIVTAASAMLAIHMKNQSVAQNIIAFFYECTQAGLVDHLKEMRQVLPTAMKALQMYPQNEVLVERSVTIACILDHPNKDSLLKSASMQYPQSKLLKQLIASMATAK